MGQPPNAGVWVYLFPLAVIGVVILRNTRARALRIERLWVAPVMILAVIALSFSQQGIPDPLAAGLDLAALVVGAGLGWWRGRFTQISVDPATHALTSRASPLGMLLILAIFAIRYGLRAYAAQNADSLHLSVTVITDAALLISAGLVCAQRLEIALRANRLLTEARASSHER
jgi:hypothetical protein